MKQNYKKQIKKQKKNSKSNAEVLQQLVKTASVNPLMILLTEINEQFDYGNNGETVKTINELLTHWYDNKNIDSSLGGKDDVSNTLFYVTKLTSFLTSLQDSFYELKTSHPELTEALTR